ncbi:MAG TPA: amidohydrolase family protein [Acidimicrobiia bacterium]|nr:amidohydrolase family protein [Acidimicrobiia bacterium]
MTAKTLIRGGCVLTMGRNNFAEADVLIDGAVVAEVGPGLRARDAEVLDATDTIVMPGFVDTHRHLWHSLFKNGGDASSAMTFGPHYGPDDLYAATLIGLLGAIDSGITTVVDWLDVGTDDSHLEAAIQAHSDSEIRSVLAYAHPTWDPTQDRWRRGLEGIRKRQDPGPRLTFAAGASSPHPDHIDRVVDDWALARHLGLRLHAHIGTDVDGPHGWLGDMAAKDLLGGDVTLVGGTYLDDADFDAISSSGTSVALTPASGMSDGDGRPSVQRLIDRGIRPGLGVGSEQTAPGDMFAQIRALISVQHATYFDLKLAGKGSLPSLLNTREVLRYATVDGSRVAGLGDTVGSLAAGRQADLILLRTDRPNIWPINDPIGAVVWGMDTSNVDWVFVAGVALKQQGQLQGDFGRARDLAIAAQARVLDAAGSYATGGVV